MAKLGQPVTNEVELPAVEEETANELGVLHRLSSGVTIRFVRKLPSVWAQRVVVSSFISNYLEEDGRVRNDMSSKEQMNMAKQIFQYNTLLVNLGLTLGCIEIVSGMPNDTNWLSALKLMPDVKDTMPDLDFGNNLHQKILFLAYFGIEDDSDMEALSNNLLEQA